MRAIFTGRHCDGFCDSLVEVVDAIADHDEFEAILLCAMYPKKVLRWKNKGCGYDDKIEHFLDHAEIPFGDLFYNTCSRLGEGAELDSMNEKVIFGMANIFVHEWEMKILTEKEYQQLRKDYYENRGDADIPKEGAYDDNDKWAKGMAEAVWEKIQNGEVNRSTPFCAY